MNILDKILIKIFNFHARPRHPVNSLDHGQFELWHHN